MLSYDTGTSYSNAFYINDFIGKQIIGNMLVFQEFDEVKCLFYYDGSNIKKAGNYNTMIKVNDIPHMVYQNKLFFTGDNASNETKIYVFDPSTKTIENVANSSDFKYKGGHFTPYLGFAEKSVT